MYRQIREHVNISRLHFMTHLNCIYIAARKIKHSGCLMSLEFALVKYQVFFLAMPFKYFKFTMFVRCFNGIDFQLLVNGNEAGDFGKNLCCY